MTKRLLKEQLYRYFIGILVVFISSYAHNGMAKTLAVGNNTMLLKTNNITLNYKKTGSGGTSLILLHGNGEDHHIFDALSDKLQNHFTIYALDSRNHGESEKTDEYSYEVMVEDVYGFIQALQLDKVDVIGFSDGAIISLLLAIKYPSTINKMALLGVNLKPSDFTDESYQFIQNTYAETKDPLFKMMLEQPNIELKEIKNIQIPTFIIAAENDIYKQETFIQLADTLPNAILKIVPDHDHGSYIIDNGMLYQELLSFFDLAK